MIKEGSKVLLIADTTLLECIGFKNLEVSPEKPCEGTVKSIKSRKYGRTRTKVVCFSPDIAPENIYEFNIKKFKEVKEY